MKVKRVGERSDLMFTSCPLTCAAAMFMEHWKRRQMRLNYEWDLTGFEDEEVRVSSVLCALGLITVISMLCLWNFVFNVIFNKKACALEDIVPGQTTTLMQYYFRLRQRFK